jgi:hypothetical protein
MQWHTWHIGSIDGLKVTADGIVWVTGPSGVYVFAPEPNSLQHTWIGTIHITTGGLGFGLGLNSSLLYSIISYPNQLGDDPQCFNE